MTPTPLVAAPRPRVQPVALLIAASSVVLLGFAATASAQPTSLPATDVPGQRIQPAAPAQPAPPPAPTVPIIPPAEVSGRGRPVTNDIGSNASVSQGVVTQADIQNKPLFRTTEFLEQIPGFILTTETAGIDANTMFLRGFLLDHGTDFAFFVDGVPINLDANPHAQGYTDLQFVIPELVSTVDYGKGPYYAQVGNFSAVGWTNIHFFDELPYGIAKIEAGSFDWFRTVVANSGHVGPGVLLYGVQFNYFDNAYSTPEDLQKTTIVLRYTMASDTDKLTLSAMIYHGQGGAEPIMPLRLVLRGQADPFTNLSPSDFIDADRFTANAQWQHRWSDDALTMGNIYASRFTLALIENPSGFLNDPVHGDQIEQIDQRWVTGINLSHNWKSLLLGDRSANTLGIQVRHDDIPRADIYHTEDRIFLGTFASAGIIETDTGLFYQNETKWADKVRTVLGLRGEFYTADVDNHIVPQNSGDKSTAMFLPKGSLVLGPWDHTEFYLNGGYSFHSNNPEGAIGTVDTTGAPVARVPLLVQARGAELGVRSQAIDNLTTSVALWQMHFESELEFDPIAEATVPLRPSDRYGIEWTNTYRIWDWLTFNADYTWSHGRLLGIDPTTPGQHIPEAVTTVFSGGPSVNLPNGLFANLRYRYWGPRYLIEDGSATSRATNLFELSTGYECLRYTLNLQIINLFNSNGHDIDFFDASAYPGDPGFGTPGFAGVQDHLFKPLQPFAARVSVTMRW